MPNQTEYEYSPAIVARWVRAWVELCTKAETPSTSYGLMIPGPTPATPKVGARQKGFSGDKLTYALIQADIERARDALGCQSLEYKVVMWVQFQFTDYGISAGMRVTETDIRAVFDQACEQMATTLGWSPEQLHPYDERKCPVCGAPIIHLRADADFCSGRCRLQAWRVARASAYEVATPEVASPD